MTEVLAASSSVLLPTPTARHHSHLHSHSPPKSNPLPRSYSFTRHNRSLKPNTPLLSEVTCSSTSHNRRLLKYYAELASNLAKSGKLQEFLIIAESIVVSGVNPSQFASLLNVELVSDGICSMINAGNLGHVVEVLRGLKKIGIGATELLDELAIDALRLECRRRLLEFNDAQGIVSLMTTLQGLGFTAKVLLEPSEVIRFCVNKRDPAAAIMYADIFPHSQVLLCNIMTEFGKKRDLVSALSVFEASKQMQDAPNMYAYRTIIDVCGLCGDYQKSRLIYEELLASNFTPNAYVFNSVMNANASDLGYTLLVYKHMQKVGVAADLASYNILLKACCISRRVDLAEEIYNEVIGLESSGVLKLDVFTYSTMIKVFADSRMWKMALEVKEHMLSRGVIPNAITWSSLISACANAGFVEKAFQLFEEMLLAGCAPNSQCCNSLLHACVEACQYDRAFRLFNSWKKNGVSKDNHLFPEAGKERSTKHDEAYNQSSCRSPYLQHESITKRYPFAPTTSTYNILMKACGTDYFRAKDLMDEMKNEGLSPDEISWSILIDIVGGSKSIEGALQILRSMHQAGVRPDVVTYTTAIKVCVEHKDLKFAYSLFAEMKRYQIKPNLVTYNTLLRARRQYGSLQEVRLCLALYQDMRKSGYKPNDYYLKQLIEEWCDGVIQNSNQHKSRFTSRSRTTLQPESLLIERVAEHLQDTNAESLSIDLRGLTKIEARIMVLAVLRMIKEKHCPGASLKNDLVIILEDEGSETDDNGHNFGVMEVIFELVQRDLGLEVKAIPKRDTKNGFQNSHALSGKEDIQSTKLASMLKFPSRRPANPQRLKISKASLNYWLRRKGNTPVNYK